MAVTLAPYKNYRPFHTLQQGNLADSQKIMVNPTMSDRCWIATS
ncbi:hypothetical protein [Nostoc sp.]